MPCRYPMNVATESAVEPMATPSLREASGPDETATTPASPAAPRRGVRPLLSLAPFVARYRWRAAAALVALIVAAGATLVVPVAVRRMIDNGFDAERAGLIDQYFAMMIVVVAVLAVSSAM